MRIDYVDKLKGLAIILVVMGHVMEQSFGINDMFSNWTYMSFHMPLFIFLSGMFALKSFENWNYIECFSFLRKKKRSELFCLLLQ